jgi:Protein of unknown function (DUF2510)
MSTPRSEGWYDDPDGSDAERFFDGRQWTPRRRRKDPARNPPSTVIHPPASGSTPSSAGGNSFPPPAAAGPYAAYPPPPGPSSSGYPPGAEPFDPGHSSGSSPVFGYPQQLPSSRSGAMAQGLTRTLAVVIGAIGLALVATAFMPWGQARYVDHAGEIVVARTVSFPGIGRPDVSGTLSDGSVDATITVNNPNFHNPGPGWVALLLGVAAVAAAAALLWLSTRNIVALSTAILGGAAGLLCVTHLFDLRGTFDNPPGLADNNFSAGAGLISACALTFLLTGFGVWAYVTEIKARPQRY